MTDVDTDAIPLSPTLWYRLTALSTLSEVTLPKHINMQLSAYRLCLRKYAALFADSAISLRRSERLA
jgi:hypothetical protein